VIRFDYTNTLSLMYTIEMFKRTLTYHVHTLCASLHTLYQQCYNVLDVIVMFWYLSVNMHVKSVNTVSTFTLTDEHIDEMIVAQSDAYVKLELF